LDTSGRSVADVIAAAIAATGVRMAFGHPGGEVVVQIDALRRAGVEFLLTHHENTAAFMAAGYGELTGTPGVCVATLGPGATNMVTGAASALLERAPVLMLTGALASGASPGTTHQALDLNALYAPVTRQSIGVTPENAVDAIESAIAQAATRPQGPVHLAIPADVATAPVAAPSGRPDVRGASTPTSANTQALARARRLIAGSRRPVAIVGLGARHAGADEALNTLIDRLGAAAATLPKAKGIVPEDGPRFVGVLEMAGDDLVIDLLREADLILTIGLDVVEFDKPWRLMAPVIRIDSIPDADHYYPVEVDLVGDIASLLRTLAPNGASPGWDVSALESHRERLAAFVAETRDRERSGSVHPLDVVEEVRAATPRTAIATCDVGAHKMLVGQCWKTYAGRRFFMANGLSSMGYSIPTATAIRLHDPSVPVVAFVGDGGLGMYLGELETLVRARVDLCIVVFADESLELIRRSQLRRGVPTEGTSFENPDFEAIGRAFGVTVEEVDSSADLRRRVDRVVAASGVRLLAAHIDRDDYRI